MHGSTILTRTVPRNKLTMPYDRALEPKYPPGSWARNARDRWFMGRRAVVVHEGSRPGVEEAIGYTIKASHLVTDLESYKAYWFCVSAIGAAGEGLQCDPAMGRAA